MTTAADLDTQKIIDRFQLKTLAECCLVLEEGVAATRDIDLGMMAGSGMIPPPFARADAEGLDVVLEKFERAEEEWGEHFTPPRILRRLVAQGRLGQKAGQGFFPYPQLDADFEQGETVQLETRGSTAIVWLNRPPANSISPQVIEELGKVWAHIEKTPEIRSMILASANPMLFCAGADIKAFNF